MEEFEWNEWMEECPSLSPELSRPVSFAPGEGSQGDRAAPTSQGETCHHRICSHLLSSLSQAKPGENGSYREPACFPIFRWCLSLLGLAMLLVVVVILGQLLSDFDLDRVPVVNEANLTLPTLPSPASTALLPTD